MKRYRIAKLQLLLFVATSLGSSVAVIAGTLDAADAAPRTIHARTADYGPV